MNSRMTGISWSPRARLAYLILAWALAVGSAIAQTTAPLLKPGDAAPAFSLSKILQAPPSAMADLTSGLKGKVVVLEFWATWCSPCMPGIDHLNELSEKFKGQPVEFIAITDEDETVINRFVKNKPIAGWIGIDPNISVFRAFQVQTRPHTTVIDQNGKIAAITMPKDLTAEAISDLLAGKTISLPVKPRVAEDDIDWDKHWYTDQLDPTFQFIIKPVPPSDAVVSKVWPNHFVGEALYLESIINWAYDMPLRRLENLLPKSKQQYRVSFWVPEDRKDMLHPLAQQAIEVGLGIKSRRENREMDAVILTVPQGQPIKLRPSAATQPMSQVLHGVMTGKKQPIKVLARQLSDFGLFSNRQVLDETGLTELYDWELPYDRAGEKVILDAIREQLGLEAVKEKRSLEILIVEKADPR